MIEAQLPLQAGKYYTVAAVGQPASITPEVFEDDLSPLAAGKGRIRVVHASSDAPAVDVAVKEGPVLISNLAFPTASDYLSVDGMTADLEVRAAGTSTVALSLLGVTIEPGKVCNVYAIGLLGGSSALNVLPLVDSVQSMEPSTAGMPRTGAGENIALLALLAVAVLALTGGIAARAATRVGK